MVRGREGGAKLSRRRLGGVQGDGDGGATVVGNPHGRLVVDSSRKETADRVK